MQNNEPVAWIPFAWYCAWLSKNNEPVWEQYEECHPATKQWDNFPDKIIPLYTHPVNPKYDPETGEPLIDGYPLFSGLPHPVKEQGKPVARRSKDRDGYWCIYQSPVEGAEPLYTGFKQLTDEEILEVLKSVDSDTQRLPQGFKLFARAILRKAQEK